MTRSSLEDYTLGEKRFVNRFLFAEGVKLSKLLLFLDNGTQR